MAAVPSDEESQPFGLPGDAALAELLKAGDADADALVRGLGGVEAVAAALNALIEWPITTPAPAGFPPAVIAYVETPRPDEAEFDADTVARAQALFQDLRFSAIAVLACAGLPACYGVRNIATVLTGSGRLVDQVRRRLQDTVYYVSSVMTPGSLAPGGIGRRWIRKVRLMHAMMRTLTLEEPGRHEHRTGDRLADLLLRKEWKDPDATPLNQAELGYVLLTFSWLVLRGWERLGIRIGQADRDAYMKTWAWIGRLMGLRKPMRGYADEPDPAAAADRLFEFLREKREDPVRLRAVDGETNEEGRQLAAALGVVLVEEQREALLGSILPALGGWRRAAIEWVIDALPAWSWRCIVAMPRTSIRLLAGESTAERLGVTRASFWHWLPGRLILWQVPWRGLKLPERPADPPHALGKPKRPRRARLFEQAPARLTSGDAP